jgi:phage-related protein (TIGR01555 family)
MSLVKKFDGWMNVLTGLGRANRDKAKMSYAQWDRPIERDLEEVYAADDVARNLVDDLPNEGTREWIEFVHENANIKKAFQDMFDLWDIRGKFRTAWSWSRLHGGAGLWLVTDADALQVQEPLDLDQIASEGGLKSIVVFSRWELVAKDIDANPASPTYGLPKTYSLSPRFGTGNTSLTIHASRILRFEGLPLPRQLFINNNYWGDSVLTGAIESIKNYNNANLYMVNALCDFSVPVMKLKNLANLFAAGQESVVQNRLASMNMCRSTLRMIALDEEEDFQYVNRSMASIPESVEKAAERLVVASKMPRTRILGESSKGLGNGGEADERKWFDFVRNQQEQVLSQPLEKLLRAIMLSPGSPTGGQVDDELSWKFKSLWQQTNNEKAELYGKVATADAIYLDRGVISPVDVAKRFGEDDFSADLVVEEILEESPEPVEAEALMNEIKQDAFKDVADVIEKEGSQYVVKSKSGKVLGKFKTKKQAEERLKEIEYFKEQTK